MLACEIDLEVMLIKAISNTSHYIVNCRKVQLSEGLKIFMKVTRRLTFFKTMWFSFFGLASLAGSISKYEAELRTFSKKAVAALSDLIIFKVLVVI